MEWLLKQNAQHRLDPCPETDMKQICLSKSGRSSVSCSSPSSAFPAKQSQLPSRTSSAHTSVRTKTDCHAGDAKHSKESTPLVHRWPARHVQARCVALIAFEAPFPAPAQRIIMEQRLRERPCGRRMHLMPTRAYYDTESLASNSVGKLYPDNGTAHRPRFQAPGRIGTAEPEYFSAYLGSPS